jgi:hypothetical protein
MMAKQQGEPQLGEQRKDLKCTATGAQTGWTLPLDKDEKSNVG